MDHSDPLGLYRALGLTPSATTEEIKAAKSRPYYIPSGDESDKAFAEAFRRATEAYEILNDPARRASYDQFARTPPEEAEGAFTFGLDHIPDGPIRCSRCGKVTLQPRYVKVSGVASGHRARLTSEEALVCASCAKSMEFENTTSSLSSGFLSRRGPYLVAWSLLRNGLQGAHDKTSDEKLMLHNARAFLKQGDVKKAYALAKLCLRSSDGRTAAEADSIKRKIEAEGGDYWNYALPDEWAAEERSSRSASSRLGKLAVIVALWVVILLIYGGIRTVFKAIPRHWESDWFASSSISEPTCNGKSWGAIQPPSNGSNSITVENFSNYNALIKIRDANTNSLVAAFFITKYKGAGTYDLPHGQYKVQFARGGKLDADCNITKPFKKIGQFVEMPTFKMDNTPDDPSARPLMLDLYDDPKQDALSQPLSAEEFDKP